MMQHVFPTYNRFPFEIVSGNGFKLTDNKGVTYLDFTSGIGVCGLGLMRQSKSSLARSGIRQTFMKAACRKALLKNLAKLTA